MRSLALIAVLSLGSSAWAQDDTGEDADGDGYTSLEGDCNDNNPDVNPGIEDDTCGDGEDNNCDGFFDEGCDDSRQRGSLQGGGGCAALGAATGVGAGGALGAVAVLSLVGLRRRREVEP